MTPHTPNRRLATLSGLALALLAALPAAAQDNVNIVVPQRRVVAPESGQSVQLTAVDADVKVVGQVATTQLRLSIRNPGRRQAEAQLLMPVPEGCVVRHFELEGLGEDGIAKVLPIEEARSIYNQIVRRAMDPGLLEFAGYNLVRSSVFPVPPSGVQNVKLIYEQVLTTDAGRIDYVLPRSESLEATGVTWSFALDVRANQPVTTIYSPSHDLATERVTDKHIRATVPTLSASSDTGPFRVSYLLAAGDELSASLIAYPDPTSDSGQGGYFLMLVGLPQVHDKQPVKREVTIVIDRSGSMRGEKMEQARESALQIIEGLSAGEAFNIIDYSNDVAMFSEKPVVKSDQTITAARDYIAALTPTGGTNIHDALIEALRQPVTPDALPMVLFLTDGLPTIGVRSEVDIREAAKKANAHDRRVFTFGVGVDVNAPLLASIARSSRATSAFVLPGEDVEVKVGQVFRRLSGPVLASPELTVVGEDGSRNTRAVRDVLPGEIPDVFDGDQLVLLGRYLKDEPLKLKLSGEYFGRPRVFEFSFAVDKATTKNAFVPRLWASRQIGVLVEELRAMGANGHGSETPPENDPRFKELVDEIVRLSTKWGVLTEYTAFLATEPGMVAGRPGWTSIGSGQNSLGLASGLAPGEGFAPDVLDAEQLARLNVRARAIESRSGGEAVNQEMNAGNMVSQSKLNNGNWMLNERLESVEFTTVRQVNDKSFFKRGQRWVEGEMLEQAGQDAERTVVFGTDEFDMLLTRLVRDNRQGVLALGGEVYLLIDGKRVLVTWPRAESDRDDEGPAGEKPEAEPRPEPTPKSKK